MPHKKLQPKRKKQKTAETSSLGTQHRNLLSSQEYAKERKKKLQKMTFMNHQYLDWGLLQEYGMDERIQQLVADKTWFRLFEIKEPTFKNVTTEFLSTLQIDKDGPSSTMTFQAFGDVHTIELNRIGYFLGLYDEMKPEEELPSSWPPDMSAEIFWSQMIQPKRDNFVPSKSLATTFAAVEHKLLHHILTHTISCKKTSHSKVTSFDMFYLYSLISGYKIDLGVEVANFIYRQVDDTRTQVIFCGGYITALLKGMRIFQQPKRDEGITCKQISAAPFRTWGLSKTANKLNPGNDEEVHEIPPAERASTSCPSPPVSGYGQLRAEIREVKEEIRKERKKNKKFRTTLFDMLKSTISFFHPAAAEQLHYETSSEDSSSTELES